MRSGKLVLAILCTAAWLIAAPLRSEGRPAGSSGDVPPPAQTGASPGPAGEPAATAAANLAGTARPAGAAESVSATSSSSATGPGAAAAPGGDGVAGGKERARTVLIIGDSLAQGLGVGLQRVLGRFADVRLLQQGRVSTGLVHIGFFSWERMLRKLYRQQPVDALIVAMGADDAGQDMWVAPKRMARFASAEWLAIYRSRIASLIRTSPQEGVPVYWIGLPAMGDPAYSRKTTLLNDIYQEQSLANGASFISTKEITSTESGDYVSHITINGKRARIRIGDRIHFNMTGYINLAEHIVEVISQQLDLVPR